MFYRDMEAPSLSELTPTISNIELTDLCSKTFTYKIRLFHTIIKVNSLRLETSI